MESKIITVGNNPGITLEDLYAEVNIITGESNVIKVEMNGDEKSLKEIMITQKLPNEVIVKGKQSSNSNVTIVKSRNRSSISTSSIHGSCVIISGGTVIVDGKVISGGNTIISIKPVQIKITVPIGTNLDGYNVSQLVAIGLNGELRLSLSGKDNALVNGASKRINVKCSGGSSSEITKVTGDITLSASGQSDITIHGNFNDVEVKTSGQSDITIHGNCINIDAEASGQSDIELIGKASGKVRSHSSGQSDITI